MNRILAVASIATLAAMATGCGEGSYTGDCDKLTVLAVKAASFPNEAAAAKAKEHLKLAQESKDKKDMAGCETHVRDAEAALEL